MKKTNWGLFAKFVFEDTKTCGHWAEDFRFSISQFDVKLTCCVRKTFHQEVASFDLFQTSNRIPRFISNLCERPTWISHGVVHFWSVLQPIRQIFEHLYENRLFYLPTKESEQKTKKKKKEERIGEYKKQATSLKRWPSLLKKSRVRDRELIPFINISPLRLCS